MGPSGSRSCQESSPFRASHSVATARRRVPAKQRRRQSDSALVLPLPRRAAAGVPGSRAPAPLIVATTVPGGILPDKSQNPRPDTPSLLPSSLPPGLLPRCSIPPDAANSRLASCWHLEHPPRPLLQQPCGSRHRADLCTWPSTGRFSGCLSGCCTTQHGGVPTFRACKRTQTTAVLEFIFCHPRNCSDVPVE